MLPLPIRDSIVSRSSLSHLSHKHNTKQHGISLLHSPDRKVSHLHSCIPFTSPAHLGASSNTPLVVLRLTNNITRNHFISIFFPQHTKQTSPLVPLRKHNYIDNPLLFKPTNNTKKNTATMPMSWDAAADAKVRILSLFLLPLLTFLLPPPASNPTRF